MLTDENDKSDTFYVVFIFVIEGVLFVIEKTILNPSFEVDDTIVSGFVSLVSAPSVSAHIKP